jgi:hypothetical protein
MTYSSSASSARAYGHHRLSSLGGRGTTGLRRCGFTVRAVAFRKAAQRSVQCFGHAAGALAARNGHARWRRRTNVLQRLAATHGSLHGRILFGLGTVCPAAAAVLRVQVGDGLHVAVARKLAAPLWRKATAVGLVVDGLCARSRGVADRQPQLRGHVHHPAAVLLNASEALAVRNKAWLPIARAGQHLIVATMCAPEHALAAHSARIHRPRLRPLGLRHGERMARSQCSGPVPARAGPACHSPVLRAA